MPPRPWRLRVEDILENIQLIQEFTQGISIDDLRSDVQKRLAVERCFEIIGEASRHVPPDIQARYPGVPWQDMREMRNVISHVYHNVSVRIMWETIQNDLPPLAPKLREILEKEP